MARLFILIVICSVAAPVYPPAQPPPLAEKYLHESKFAKGETALLLALDANPTDDEVRFGPVTSVNLNEVMHGFGV
jgi:hypothetical protein